MLSWLLAAHVGGVILWAAGVSGAGCALVARAKAGDDSIVLPALARRLLLRSAHSGMALAVIAGTCALVMNPGYYLKEGWMIGKLATALVAVAATVALSIEAARMAGGAAAAGARPRLWSGLFIGSVTVALWLVFVKPI